MNVTTLPDFCLAILWIDESRPHAWFSRSGFTHARKCVLLLWLFMGSFLSMGYKSNLRASLIAINYNEKFETFHDLVQSEIPVSFPNNQMFHDMLSTDPRPTVQEIYKNAIFYPFDGVSPKWSKDM